MCGDASRHGFERDEIAPSSLTGDPDGPEGSVSGVEIELSDMDQLRNMAHRHSDEPGAPAEAAEYAGSRSGE